MSQLIRYARACTSYCDFITRAKILTFKLMKQGYIKQRLITVLKKFYGRYTELVGPYTVTISKLMDDIFENRTPLPNI